MVLPRLHISMINLDCHIERNTAQNPQMLRETLWQITVDIEPVSSTNRYTRAHQ